MAGISELPSDHQQPQGQTQQSSFESEADKWNQQKADIVNLVASSVMSGDAEYIKFRGGGVDFGVSFKSPSSGQPTMHATMGSFMRDDPMSRPMPPQFSSCASHPFGHPQGAQSSAQFGQSLGGQTGQPFGQTGQPFGQSYQSQPGWPGLGSQAPQPAPPQGYFGQSFGSSVPPQFSQGPPNQSNLSFNGQPGGFQAGLGNVSSAPPGNSSCCSVGGGFCHGMPTPPDTPGGGLFGPGAPNVTQYTYDPNAPIWGSNATSNTSNPWQQQQTQSFGEPQPPQPPQFGGAYSGQGTSDAVNSAVRDLCASSCMTRAEVFKALSHGTGCGLPGCGCDACHRANKLSVHFQDTPPCVAEVECPVCP